MKLSEQFDQFGEQNRYTNLLFSMFGFDKVIAPTIEKDPVVQDYLNSSGTKGFSHSAESNVSQSLYQQFVKNFSSTREMYDKLQGIRSHYLVKAIVQSIIDDALAPDPSTGNILTVNVSTDYTKSNKAQKEVDAFLSDMAINQMLDSVLADAIFWGEYFLENKGNSKEGINKIIDSNPPGSIFGVYEGVEPEYFFRLKKTKAYSMASYDIERLKPADVWHLSIFPRKLKFSLGHHASLSYSSKDFQIAQHFRVGEPLFIDVYDKILELEALEQSQLAKSLGDIKRNALVSVQAPAGLKLKQLGQISKYYEKILNDVGIDSIYEIGGLDKIKMMVSGLANARVIPVQPDRGALEPLNMKTFDTSNVKDDIQDRREIICQSIGFPYDYILTSRDSNKSTELRQYIRYSRLLKRVQRGTSYSIQLLLRTHLLNKGFTDINIKDLDVKFYNTINASELDRLEFVDALVSLLGSFNDFINELGESDESKKYVSEVEKLRFIKKSLSTIDGAENIINNLPEEIKGKIKNV